MKRFALVVVALLFSVGTAAADGTKLDFSAVILDQDGKPFIECSDPQGIPVTDAACKAHRSVTLGILAFRALIADKAVSPEDNALRGALALEVYRGGQVSLTVEQIAEIKKSIGSTFNPLVTARCFPLLDPATAAAK
jgi:hypothetical protein